MDPLQTPPRDVPARRRPAKRGEDKSGLWAVVGIAAVLVLGIGYAHRADIGLGPADGVEVLDGGDVLQGNYPAAEGGAGPARAAGLGARKEVGEPTLKMAEPVQQDRYAAPVTHVTETDACRALKNSRSELKTALGKSVGAERKAELQDELDYVISRGTERGCWTGGAG
ncbi:hypothetical protein [Panacagrimonas sp.]|uniref:hypothetical protein n=1 Tax=Panacagrimonas sp. TaxID=2480088 RepID=UPI003B52F5F2